jgi:hypothetical protein
MKSRQKMMVEAITAPPHVRMMRYLRYRHRACDNMLTLCRFVHPVKKRDTSDLSIMLTFRPPRPPSPSSRPSRRPFFPSFLLRGPCVRLTSRHRTAAGRLPPPRLTKSRHACGRLAWHASAHTCPCTYQAPRQASRDPWFRPPFLRGHRHARRGPRGSLPGHVQGRRHDPARHLCPLPPCSRDATRIECSSRETWGRL